MCDLWYTYTMTLSNVDKVNLVKVTKFEDDFLIFEEQMTQTIALEKKIWIRLLFWKAKG